MVHVTPDRQTADLTNMRGLIFELNSASGASALIADLSTVDPLFARQKHQFGAAVWSRGRFLFASFDKHGPTSVHLTAVHAERLTRALEDR
jgi:hypothetical protein